MKYVMLLIVLVAFVGCSGWDTCIGDNDQRVSCKEWKDANKTSAFPGGRKN